MCGPWLTTVFARARAETTRCYASRREISSG
ncbi:hypothetical protein E2C01_097020 [Portunus trituberculatus]|uniref:Uncharacterized protein n=1 Tax=Portunus trituberculatus TaxID=210409 RepID=A0A5B7K8E5_PORTR|nr:hypothetical protein [Portunus trituberculatus]